MNLLHKKQWNVSWKFWLIIIVSLMVLVSTIISFILPSYVYIWQNVWLRKFELINAISGTSTFTLLLWSVLDAKTKNKLDSLKNVKFITKYN